MGEINVVPYIDVMLVLLVIFMVTAPLLTQGIEVDLPRANAEPIESVPDHDPLVISVDAAGNLYINAGDDEDKPIDAQTLVTRVGALLRIRPGIPVVVRGDRSVPYGQVVHVMTLLQKAGAPSVGLVTDPQEAPPG